MNIVFAYHDGDLELAIESSKAITAMGINLRHKASVITTPNTNGLSIIMEELKKSFQSVGHIVAQGGFNGWPLGPNQMFLDAAVHCYQNQEPWYFWEPDCVPMKQGWVDDLESEYKKKPAIMGHMFEGGVASNGKNIYKMIVGSAVYPNNFLDYCPAARSLGEYNMAYRSSGTVPEPWDVRCRYNFLAIGRDTPLIRTYWKSVNYQWKEGKIVFFAEDPEAQAVQNATCPDRFISSQAVVIHGCKDGSLHRMAIDGFSIPANSMVLEEERPVIATPQEEVVVVCRKSKKAEDHKQPKKKKRNLSPEERKRRSDAMKAIVEKKRERKAKDAV